MTVKKTTKKKKASARKPVTRARKKATAKKARAVKARPIAQPAGDATANSLPETRPSRVVIAKVKPQIDGGIYPVKSSVGQPVTIEAVVISDGHDHVKANLLHRKESASEWTKTPLKPLGNDRWQGEFIVDELGFYVYSVEASIDRWATWRHDIQKRLEAKQSIETDLIIARRLLEHACQVAKRPFKSTLESALKNLSQISPKSRAVNSQVRSILDDQELTLALHWTEDAESHTTYEKQLQVQVDPELASFSAWYEFFPRSTGKDKEHGTLRSAADTLEYVSKLGFDIVYLPPIHPIGVTHRKGKNNSLTPTSDDVGSPWAIGSTNGGHKAIDPQLGNWDDFDAFVKKAESLNLKVAMDIAFQCSPDHPYVKDHPEWFKKRPDGSIQYAENPPKKYQDIYPLDFENDAWKSLWQELKSVFTFWMDKGIRVFRVDNPHTKPFAFWHWLIQSIRKTDPDVIFLSEAFTRPHIMAHLAKIGFNQSYTYFTWRNTKHEITEYLTELTLSELKSYFRPNFWPNTPDILPQFLQAAPRSAFILRYILAATSSPNYGMYGPAFELLESTPREAGSEEYLDSEKYQTRNWNLKQQNSIAPIIKRVNTIRKNNRALQAGAQFRFLDIPNEHLLAFLKQSVDQENFIITVINLDPFHKHYGMLELPLWELGIPEDQPFQVHDLLTDSTYTWEGKLNYVELDPNTMPAHIFKLKAHIRSEQDFDTYR